MSNSSKAIFLEYKKMHQIKIILLVVEVVVEEEEEEEEEVIKEKEEEVDNDYQEEEEGGGGYLTFSFSDIATHTSLSHAMFPKIPMEISC